MKYRPFDALKVNLQGNNLIEASAGTGKTYSIAILVLRLVIEQNIPVNKILMVTFTNAAVAELQERIRKFLKEAYHYSTGKEIADESIKSIINHSAKQLGKDNLQQRLKDAVLLIDELEIMTIHGFCQQALNEFAFETNRIFGAEFVTGPNDILEDQVNIFWRKHITTLDPFLLAEYNYINLKGEIKEVVQLHLDGKRYAPYSNTDHYSAADFDMAAYTRQVDEARESLQEAKKTVIDTFNTYQTEIKNALDSARKSKDKDVLLSLIDDAESFIEYRRKNSKTAVLDKAPQEFHYAIETYKSVLEQSDIIASASKRNLFCFAIQEIGQAVQKYMSNNNLLNYNSLIESLHTAISSRANYRLVNELRKKYKAVFIDEFQDTDKQQYEIFEVAFLTDYFNNNENPGKEFPFLKYQSVTFLIGDPKQSIYGFRKADIFTYFKARNFIGENLYGMQTNYRSTADLIAAMNHFFQPDKDFDTFYNTDSNNTIEYQNVSAPANEAKGILYIENTLSVPISIIKQGNKDEILTSVANTVLSLLSGEDNYIVKGEEKRKVLPSDICVLVRSNKEGIAVKDILNNISIPAVFLNNLSILQSNEATEMLYLLEAFLLPNRGNINRVLIGCFLNFTTNQLLEINEEVLISRFLKYNEVWKTDGIYPAVMRFANEFDITNANRKQSGNERQNANFYQLTELLNKTEHQKRFSQEEMISWLKRSIETGSSDGDENLMRIESDEQAVNITTIHKSKGLEYNIVLCPFLDFNNKNINNGIVSYRNNEGEYVFNNRQLLNSEEKNLFDLQQEQENRRLIYVAITRAVLKCFIFKNNHFKSSSITPFVNHQNILAAGLIEEGELAISGDHQYFQPDYTIPRSEDLIAENFRLEHPDWGRWSYSKLSAHGDISLKEKGNNFDNDYDEFAFDKLRYGALTGNFLHHLLEKTDFSGEEKWKEQITKIAGYYYVNASKEFLEHIEKLLHHITNSVISTGEKSFSLKEVNYRKRLQELEFNFLVPPFRLYSLLNFSKENLEIRINTNNQNTAEGVFNGFIDLMFEHNGRYYILDWKSNYLGYSLEDYTAEKLHQAMNEQNYHLQYLLYCVAVKKYLSSRMANFNYDKHFGGVIYLFIRGVREGSSNGIFYTHPTLHTIQKLEGMISEVVEG